MTLPRHQVFEGDALGLGGPDVGPPGEGDRKVLQGVRLGNFAACRNSRAYDEDLAPALIQNGQGCSVFVSVVRSVYFLGR